MATITWRNVAGPDFGQAADIASQGSAQVNQGIGQLRDVLKVQRQNNINAENNQTKALTDTALTNIFNIGDANQLQAAGAEILNNAPAGVDKAVLIDALNKQGQNLQGRALTAANITSKQQGIDRFDEITDANLGQTRASTAGTKVNTALTQGKVNFQPKQQELIVRAADDTSAQAGSTLKGTQLDNDASAITLKGLPQRQQVKDDTAKTTLAGAKLDLAAKPKIIADAATSRNLQNQRSSVGLSSDKLNLAAQPGVIKDAATARGLNMAGTRTSNEIKKGELAYQPTAQKQQTATSNQQIAASKAGITNAQGRLNETIRANKAKEAQAKANAKAAATKLSSEIARANKKAASTAQAGKVQNAALRAVTKAMASKDRGSIDKAVADYIALGGKAADVNAVLSASGKVTSASGGTSGAYKYTTGLKAALAQDNEDTATGVGLIMNDLESNKGQITSDKKPYNLNRQGIVGFQTYMASRVDDKVITDVDYDDVQDYYDDFIAKSTASGKLVDWTK